MISQQAQLAAAAVLGFRYGGPMAQRLLASIPGFPADQLGADLAGVIAAALSFWTIKRFVR